MTHLTPSQGRASIRRFVRNGSFGLTPEGLYLDRDELRYPEQVSMTEVIERLEAIGVASDSMGIEIRVGREKHAGKMNAKAFARLRIDMVGTAHLATIYPEVAEALERLRGLSPGSASD